MTKKSTTPYYNSLPLQEQYSLIMPTDSNMSTYTQYVRNGRGESYPYSVKNTKNLKTGDVTVEENGLGPYGTSVYIKNVYSPDSVKLQSDTLYGGVPINDISPDWKKQYEKLFTSDKDDVILAGYPMTKAGFKNYFNELKQVSKEKIISYFDYLKNQIQNLNQEQ